MKNVLFVDDDSGIINGLKRMLRPLRNEWKMHFVLSGQEALDLMAENAIDVIVSDMRMPGMNGAELLSRVKEEYPKVIRLVLSGYSDQDLLFKAVLPAHQFLSKPCDAETLKKTVQRTSELQALLSSQRIKEVVAQADTLPSLPHLYAEIISRLNENDVSIKEIAEIIQKDVAMSAQILKLVNSSFFGFFKKVSSIVQASTLLGLNTIKSLVLSCEIFSTLKTNPNLDFSFEDLSRHSTLTAVFAKEIAKQVSDDKIFREDAFMAGLLHDIGILVLSSKMPDEYVKVLNLAREKNIPIWEAERSVFQTTHAEMGAYLLGLWGFTDNIIEALANHHVVKVFGDEPHSLVMVLHIADAFARHLDDGSSNITTEMLDQSYLKEIGLFDKAKQWLEKCKEIYEAGAF